MDTIVANNIVKQYRSGTQALSGLSLRVKTGELFSLLGKNGAGKSTLLQILSTYQRPTSGEVLLFGKDLKKECGVIRGRIASVSQNTSIDTCLSLRENMRFQGRLYRVPKAKAVERVEQLIGSFELAQYAAQPVASFSGGVRRRLDLAVSLMSNPDLLFLDEPTVGMDPGSRRDLWEMLRIIRSQYGATIVMSTHYLEEAERLSDTICVMDAGKVLAQGTPQDLRGLWQKKWIELRFDNVSAARSQFPKIRELCGDMTAALRENAILIEAQNAGETLWHLMNQVSGKRIALQGAMIHEPTLEDVFLRLTHGRGDGA